MLCMSHICIHGNYRSQFGKQNCKYAYTVTAALVYWNLNLRAVDTQVASPMNVKRKTTLTNQIRHTQLRCGKAHTWLVGLISLLRLWDKQLEINCTNVKVYQCICRYDVHTMDICFECPPSVNGQVPSSGGRCRILLTVLPSWWARWRSSDSSTRTTLRSACLCWDSTSGPCWRVVWQPPSECAVHSCYSTPQLNAVKPQKGNCLHSHTATLKPHHLRPSWLTLNCIYLECITALLVLCNTSFGSLTAGRSWLTSQLRLWTPCSSWKSLHTTATCQEGSGLQYTWEDDFLLEYRLKLLNAVF